MSPDLYPTISYETAVLEKLKLSISHAVSRQMLSGIQGISVDSMVSEITDSLLLRLRAFVLNDPKRNFNKVYEFSYVQAHPTWKHALVASLPEGSFRRRWCHFFWDIPLDYKNTRVTQRVEVDVKGIFPESTMQYPDSLGPIHYVTHINPLGATYAQF